jgi:hypothetical protein
MGGRCALVLLQFDLDTGNYLPFVLFMGKHLKPRLSTSYNLLYDREYHIGDGDNNRLTLLTPQE